MVLPQQLPELKSPRWLTGLTADSIMNGPMPLRELLQESLYYPASGFDGDPIKYLAGNIFSFVYVDYGYEESDFLLALEQPGFKGYELVASRLVAKHELGPMGRLPGRPRGVGGSARGDADWIKAPFCHWAVFEREPTRRPSDGPSRFSLLYLCADGVAAFEALYAANAVAPKAVAVIQPGHGFGGNWTDFTDPEGILARTVRGNTGRQPEILLYGGVGKRDGYRIPCWPEYCEHLGWLDKAGGGSIGVWRRGG